MGQLVWLIVLAALLFGLHVTVVVYLYRTATTDGPSQAAEEPTVHHEQSAHLDDRGGPQSVSCPTCGMPNDPSYRFCRSCVSDLSSRPSATDGPSGTDRLGN